jgi:TPP-dependent pyruvate/acetoin dehydrogenase alpha subunit
MLENKLRLKLLFEMLRIRKIEEKIAEEYKEQEMRCPMHLSIGQESVAVAVSQNLNKNDAVFTGHRSHGHYLAKGGSLKKFIAELYGKETGCVGGIGGSMHLLDKNAGFLGSTPIVGGIVPVAAGNAWYDKLKNKKTITVIYIGDGCFEEGVIHETFNFCVLHSLPIVFVCENNNFSVYTPLSERQPNRAIYKIAKSHGLISSKHNGKDVEKLFLSLNKIITSTRKMSNPSFVEIDVYRWREHCGPDFDNELNYRTKKEISSGLKECPIEYYTKALERLKILNKPKMSHFIDRINKEFDAAHNYAKASVSSKASNNKEVYAK